MCGSVPGSICSLFVSVCQERCLHCCVFVFSESLRLGSVKQFFLSYRIRSSATLLELIL